MRALQHDELMGGRRQPRLRAIQPGQDENHVYAAACIDFADSFGYEPGQIQYWWSQIALAREGCGEPRDLAEWMALQNVREVFDCRGRSTN